jgi:hypothetical protein
MSMIDTVHWGPMRLRREGSNTRCLCAQSWIVNPDKILTNLSGLGNGQRTVVLKVSALRASTLFRENKTDQQRHRCACTKFWNTIRIKTNCTKITVTCKLRWHAKKLFQLFKWKQPTRSPPQRGKEINRKRVADLLPIQSSSPCERTPKLCTHSQERRQNIRTKLQTNWAKNPENPVTRMRTSSHPPTLHEASTNPLLEFEIRCAISSASNRTEVGKGKKTDLLPNSTSSSDPAATGRNSSNFLPPWDISVHSSLKSVFTKGPFTRVPSPKSRVWHGCPHGNTF